MIPDTWWTNFHSTPVSQRCEAHTCCCMSTHVLHMDDDEIRLCEFHIGKFALIAMSLQIHAGCQVSVHKIERGQDWQAEQARLSYEGE